MKFFSASLCSVFILWISALPAFSQSSSTAPTKKDLTIEAIFAEGGMTGRAPENVKWSPDNTKLSFVQRDDSGERGELWYVDAATGERKVLVNEMKLAALAPPTNNIKDERQKEWVTRYHVAAYEWAPDSKHLLFDSQGQLWLYALANGTAVQLTSSSDASQDPKFSPDGGRLAYMRAHNLYVRTLANNQERELTKDKNLNLLNGEVDWLYAEELNVRSNYFWSPDGKEIAFLHTDETQVPTYPITNWAPIHPQVEEEKYPKAGDPNPVVRIGMMNSGGGDTKWFSPGEHADMYIPRFGWVRSGLLWAEVLNRAQTEMDLYFVDAYSGNSRIMLHESDPKGWINVNDDFKIVTPGDRFLWSSWRDGTTQLYLYSFDPDHPLAAEAKLEHQLTQGNFEVLGVDAVDEAAGVVYFSCNAEDTRQTQLYSVKLDGSDFRRVSQEVGTHELNFSDDSEHYADVFSTLTAPPELLVCNLSSSCHQVWNSHGLQEEQLATPQFLEFKADDGTTLDGELLLPTNAQGGKIPLIVYVYGGPAEQLVRDQWGGTTGLFHQLLARDGFAVFTVDNRGTPNRDRKFQTAIRGEFGALELKDQLASLEQLFARFPQLDRSRVGIWGWSNGGSMTLYAMEHSDLFKTGVSVAPVTDWRLYDTAYTERYLGLPKDNAAAYENSSMTKAAEELHGTLLLVHGTSDDNVHFQNSVQMVNALVQASKQFRFMVYPDKTHGIGGATDRDHLFHMIENHFERELK